MDIDRSNFRGIYTQLISLIESCDFLSIDCKYSGVTSEKDQKINKYDSDEDVYQKMKHTVSNYHLLQFGLCLYTFDAVAKKYVAFPFNAYLNPNYSTQSESIKKQMIQLKNYSQLAQNGLDFNRVYANGLSYSKLSERGFPKKTHINPEFFSIGLTESDSAHLTRILKELQEFEANPAAKEIVIDCHSAYIVTKITRRQLHEDLFFWKGVMVEKGSAEHLLLVRKKKPGQFIGKSPEERLHEKKLKESQKDDVDSLGFSLIVEAIINARRPIVGYNMGLDIFYLFDHFVEQLPSTFIEFIEKVTKIFPYFVDTKFLAKRLETIIRLPKNLSGIYKQFAFEAKDLHKFHNTIISEDPAFLKYAQLGENTIFEAGFDAYMNGVAFVGMCYFEWYSSQIASLKQKNAPITTNPVLNQQVYAEKMSEIYKKTIHNYLNPRFAMANVNCVYIRSDEEFVKFDFAVQNARGEQDRQHAKKYISNTFYFEFDQGMVSDLSQIITHFSNYGDVQIVKIDENKGFAEYEQFEQIDKLEVEGGDTVDHSTYLLPYLNSPVFKVELYANRIRFQAYSYFE